MKIVLIVLLVLSLSANFAAAFGVINILKKIEMYEDYFESLHGALSNVFNQIKAIDIRGSFEADDEVGIVYQGIRGMIFTLEGFLLIKDADGPKEAD